MFKAKLTNQGQITIPVEMRRLLDLHAGDILTLSLNDKGLMLNKSAQPLTIEERFANYNIINHKDAVNVMMKEIDTVYDKGVEIYK